MAVMLKFTLAAASLVLLAGSALAVNPPAENAGGPVLHSTIGEFTGRNFGTTEPVADVRPGQTVTITGDCLARTPSADNLRVVLTMAAGANGTAPGYRPVVATDQRISEGSLQVRVPDMPEAENHVFQVKIFRLDEQAPQICDAGSIRIGAQPAGKVG
jgi:hypothetical protein